MHVAVFHEELIVSQVVKEISRFLWNQNVYRDVFTGTRHLTPARLIQPTFIYRATLKTRSTLGRFH
jgi:hypothetical protein